MIGNINLYPKFFSLSNAQSNSSFTHCDSTESFEINNITKSASVLIVDLIVFFISAPKGKSFSSIHVSIFFW